MDSRNHISLCVIVKDQAPLLERLLRHHAALYDQAVVVDTGSRDESAAVARRQGALVASFDWVDDFSAARNRGLELASEPWILVLDCDELIAAADFAGLEALVRGDQDICHVLPQLNYLPRSAGGMVERTDAAHGELSLGAPVFRRAWSIRLFPNLGSLRYRGAVHESLDESALTAGCRLRQQNLPIHHQGHLLTRAGGTSRNEFYGRLLARKLEGQPGDPRCRYEMAAHLAGTGQSELAARLLQLTLRSHPHWNDRHRAELLLGQIRSSRGDAAAAGVHFQRALQARPDWPQCWAVSIDHHLTRGDLTRARQQLDQARKLFPAMDTWDQFQAQVQPTSGR